ncbi:MAG TPA: ribonuclease HII [Candidatus Kapabacteria bacterium]|nr:ribonuclease HII [Candidatus Kapabacteria bacterium]
MNLPDFTIENQYWGDRKLITGIDEAGRGSLAGPVVAAAVVLPPYNLFSKEINDSKKLRAAKRDELFDIIQNNAISIGIGIVDSSIIDKINILNATFLAMEIAISKLNTHPEIYLIDGNRFSKKSDNYITIIDGDSKSYSIASASIIAKVVRDRMMADTFHHIFPEYGFNEHFGYGTKFHFMKIDEYGPCLIHRTTFLRKYFARKNQIKIF